LTLSSEKFLFFYKYEIPNEKSQDDVKRLQSKGLYKLVQQFSHPSAHQILDYSTHNAIFTHLALVAGSNKDILVYDINSNKVISQRDSTHFKPVYSVRFFKPSMYFGYAYSDFDVFVTTSTDNYTKVWDLRAMEPIMELSSHQNRSQTVGLDISPCKNYLLHGSEDRSLYIYDLRTGKALTKTKGSEHGDVVSDVAISPLNTEFATTSYDGTLRLFHSSKIKTTTGGTGGGMVSKEKRIQEPDKH